MRASERATSQFPNPGQTSCTDAIGDCARAMFNRRIVFNLRVKAMYDRRRDNQKVDTMSVASTLDGKFDLFGHDWY